MINKIFVFFGEFGFFNHTLLGKLENFFLKSDSKLKILTFKDYGKLLQTYFGKDKIELVLPNNELYMTYRRGCHGQPNTGNPKNFDIINSVGKVPLNSKLLLTNSWLEYSEFYSDWQKFDNVNKFGASKDTIYKDPIHGPLPDNTLESSYSFFEYLLKYFPNQPWKKYYKKSDTEILDLCLDLLNIKPKDHSIILPKKLIQFKPYNKKNLIHIFPRLRKGSHWGNKNHPSYVDFFKWNDICKLLKSNYLEFKICCHGHIESFDNIQYDIKTSSIEDSANYLFNSQIFISPISGYAEFAYNCGVKYIILVYDKKNLPTIIPIKDNNRIFYININDNLDKLRLLLNNLLQKFNKVGIVDPYGVDKIKGNDIIIDI